MQSRAVGKRSIGLMLLVGLGIFGAIFLWLKGVSPRSQTYNVIGKFVKVPGLQPGGVVLFRGIKVGNIAKIEPGVNGVDVVMQMDSPNSILPKDVTVEISQISLIGEPVIEIIPHKKTAINVNSIAKPLDSKCDRNLILCHNSKIDGQIGISFNESIRRSTKLVELYSNPRIIENINSTLLKIGSAAEDISQMSRNIDKTITSFSGLPKTVESGLNDLSVQANMLIISVERTNNKIRNAADNFNNTTDRLSQTAAEYEKLAVDVSALVNENRQIFASYLRNFNLLSIDLRKTINTINPSIIKLNTTLSKVNLDKLLRDLETVLINVNQDSLNFRNISTNLSDPKTLLILKQTLDSARLTLQNIQKITSDLDDLTGNPELRFNIKNLVNGLNKLVSSAEQLEQQAMLAQSIEPLSKSLDVIGKLPPLNSSAESLQKVKVSTEKSKP